jgi:hypothetical protein
MQDGSGRKNRIRTIVDLNRGNQATVSTTRTPREPSRLSSGRALFNPPLHTRWRVKENPPYASCFASHASEILQGGCDKTTRRANHLEPVQPPREKYFALFLTQLSCVLRASHPTRGALRTSRNARVGCGGRGACERRSQASADGEAVWS